jgi:hypothetical protein
VWLQSKEYAQEKKSVAKKEGDVAGKRGRCGKEAEIGGGKHILQGLDLIQSPTARLFQSPCLNNEQSMTVTGVT